jgi:hypothetical protein
MNVDSKDIVEAIQKAAKVDAVEKLLWDIKGSIKGDLQTFAHQTKQDIVAANQLQVEQFKNSIKDILKDFKKEEVEPLAEEVQTLKSDKKALKWVAATISAFITFIGSVVTLIISK